MCVCLFVCVHIFVCVYIFVCVCVCSKWCCFSRRSVYRLENKPLISGSRPPDAKYSSVAPYGGKGWLVGSVGVKTVMGAGFGVWSRW